MSQSTRGERVTAAVSALAAVIILGAAVTAQQSRTAPVNRLTRLESDLRFQLDLAYRTNAAGLKTRFAEVDRTLDAWRRSPRAAADEQLLAEWLHASIDRSMPGESGKLPPTPEFSRPSAPPVAGPPAAKPLPAIAEPTPSPTAKPVVEPVAVPEGRPTIVEPRVAAPVATAPIEVVPVAPVVARPALADPRSAVPLLPPAAKTAVVAAKPVEVNLAELNARIAGYHQGLADVEAAIAADGALDLDQLSRLVGRLEQLSHHYQLVRLYFEALTDRERAKVTAPREMRPTVELVDRERAHLEQDGEGDFLAAFEVGADGKASPLAVRLRAVAELVAPAETK